MKQEETQEERMHRLGMIAIQALNEKVPQDEARTEKALAEIKRRNALRQKEVQSSSDTAPTDSSPTPRPEPSEEDGTSQSTTSRPPGQPWTEEIRRERLRAFEESRSMTQEEALEQMKRNGAVMKPNPWYRGPEKTED